MWIEYLRIALGALRAHKFRSLLTVLSITVGTSAIVLMSSLADSGLSTLKKGIEDLGGAKLLFLAPKAPERARARQSAPRGFTVEDRDWLFTGLPHVTQYAMFAVMGTRDVSSDAGKTVRGDVVAADSRFLEVFRMRLDHGLTFTEEDNRQRAQVCVVGKKLAEKLWDAEPVGRMLTVEGFRCRVIGELADNDRLGVNFGFDWNDLVVAPQESVADVAPAARIGALLIAKTDAATSNDPVKRIINALLVERRHGVDDFEIYDFSTSMKKFESVFAIMEAIVGLIAGIALLIGGVGVMNMMLVSVSERVREIGIRKALGAGPGDIGAQFIAESLLLSGLGGLVGVGLGVAGAVGASIVIGHFLKSWVGAVSTTAAAVAFGVSLLVGVVFGYFPARQAGRLDPIEAIRR